MAFIGKKGVAKKELLKKVGNIEQVACIKPYEMKSGRASGVKALDISTGGGLDITVLEGKCLDIYSMKYRGMNLSFISKPGLSSSEYFNPHGSEFLRYFQAGMLYTCGLSNIGSPCRDGSEEYNIHGRISQIPAEKVGIEAYWDENDYIMKISGEMREAALFNENLVLKRTITTSLGAKTVKICDRVENQGFEEQPVMLLYHFNLGYPLLDEGARVVLPDIATSPRTEEAHRGISDWEKITAPVDGFKEHVFYHENAADEEGNTFAALINDCLGLGFYIKYNIKQLPVFAQWKSMASGDYALGLEPGNHHLEGRESERRNNTLKSLSPLESLNFGLELGVIDGEDEIKEFERKIESLKKKYLCCNK